MSERLRSILAVAVLTAAVWVWADLEQTGENQARVPVQVSVPANYVIRRVTPEYVTVKFKGPLGELQALKTSPEDMVCRYDLPESELKGNRAVLKTRDGFRHWQTRRITVTDTSDESENTADGTITVDFDRLVEVKVRVEPAVTGAVATAVTAQPPEVMARVAESAVKALPEAKRYVVARLAISSTPPTQQVEMEVPLECRIGGADGIEAELNPPIVKVTARLGSAVTTKSLGRFSILVTAPPEMLNRYRVIFQPEAPRWVELEVQGPGPDLERLTPQDLRVQLILTADDKPDPDSWLPGKPTVVGLPPGVKLVKPLPTVNFNLEKQTEKAAGPRVPETE